MDMGDVTRRLADEQRLRSEYDYLFAPERTRLLDQIDSLESRCRNLCDELAAARKEVGFLQSNVRRLEEGAAKRSAKSKPYNRVVFDLKATIDRDAQVVLDAMLDMYGRARGGSIRLTHGNAAGQTLHVWIEYDVCGGHPADMRRMLKKVLDRTSSALIEDPTITVISRTPLTDDGQPISPAPEP